MIPAALPIQTQATINRFISSHIRSQEFAGAHRESQAGRLHREARQAREEEDGRARRRPEGGADGCAEEDAQLGGGERAH